MHSIIQCGYSVRNFHGQRTQEGKMGVPDGGFALPRDADHGSVFRPVVANPLARGNAVCMSTGAAF